MQTNAGTFVISGADALKMVTYASNATFLGTGYLPGGTYQYTPTANTYAGINLSFVGNSVVNVTAPPTQPNAGQIINSTATPASSSSSVSVNIGAGNSFALQSAEEDNPEDLMCVKDAGACHCEEQSSHASICYSSAD
jgi:hypothetical protein